MRFYKSMKEIKDANKLLGHNWFSRETMNFFSCIVSPRIYHGCFFITSECYLDKRFYSARLANADGRIETIGEPASFITKNDALHAIENYFASMKWIGK